ncbi:major facilitator superfamily domain-containing protein [Dichotomopilus funicola]|uniref:Major facilitator superfamily domain-containing protein n=1 Tax=Dichotomopilus funicola TaxID=1934379 RepID=A0AAN6ZLX3_9PEZI|nr:major facilitator superfamily domain-containing protein [Dichotomopilus funicola]
MIIGLAAFGRWFSSISSFSYFSAIPFLASDLGVSVQQVNLTVTSYLIMSGIFPSIMGDAADRFGRRPVFLAALIIYFAANIGLALQGSFSALFVLRMLQSAGISGTFSIAYGVLGDLFTPAERGGYSGIISFFINTPPSFGPVLSGVLLLRWSWRSIFWFLAIGSGVCLTLMVLLLPETARNIVGNGTIPARDINRALIPLPPNRKYDTSDTKPAIPPQQRRRNLPNPLTTLQILRKPGTAIVLVSYGINYTVYCCLQASLSSLFVNIYHVSRLVAGLVYLPFGIAVALSAFGTGNLLDFDFKKTVTGTGAELMRQNVTDLGNFQIERARLRTVVFSVALGAAFTMGYGWSLRAGVSMAVPLLLQFLIGLTIQMVFTALNTLLVDLHPDRPSTAQAACNFVRCEMAAACLAGLDAFIQSVGPG